MVQHVDERQKALLAMVPQVDTVADIGTDHGKLPALLLQTGKCKNAILADISKPSLQKAKDLLASLGLQASFIVSDGLQNIHQTMDCIVIAGMGSSTMCDILQKGKSKLKGAQLVLSPNLKHEETRAFLQTIGYAVVKESLVYTNHKMYTIMLAQEGAPLLSEKEIYIGKISKNNTSQLVQLYLLKKQKELQIALQGMQNAKSVNQAELQSLQQKLNWIAEELLCIPANC